jgi:hypothetical protein
VASDSKILREYLLSLGFKINTTETKKFDDTVGKLDKGAQRLALSLGSVAASALAMVTVFARSMEKLYYSTQRAESSAGNLRALEYAANKIGIGGDQMRASIEGMARAMRMNPGLVGFVEGLGIPVQGRDKSKVMLDLLGVLKQMPFYVGAQYAGMFGIGPDEYLLLTQGLDKMKEAVSVRDEMARQAGLDQTAAAKAGVEYMNQLDMITEKLKIMKDTAMIAFLEPMKAAGGYVNSLIDQLTQTIKKVGEVNKTDTRSVPEVMLGNAKAINRDLGLSHLPGAAADLLRDGILEYGGVKKYRKTLGMAHNNPGNIMSGKGGTMGTYRDNQEGLDAMAGLLLRYQQMGLNTIEGIVSRYAPPKNPDGTVANNTKAYIANMAAALGVGARDMLDLKDPAVLAKLMGAMIKQEQGYSPFTPMDLLDSAQMRLGGGYTFNQTTQITVTGTGAEETARAVAGHQDRVNATLLRNAQGAVR